MGAEESKEFNKEMNVFPPEERTILSTNFAKLSVAKNKADRSAVENAMKNQYVGLKDTDVFFRRICDLMTGQIATINTVTFEGYIHCASIMLHGILEEKATQVLYLAKGQKGPASYEDCVQLAKFVIQICFHILHKTAAFRSWNGNCTHIFTEESVVHLAAALTAELQGISEQDGGIDQQAACRWLSRNHQFHELLDLTAHSIFQLPMARGKQLIPLCRGIPAQVYPSWLTLSDVLFVNCSLPSELRNEWRFLFSSRIHGESFSSLMGYIVGKGPSVIFIRDTDGHIFGGFASTAWSVGPQFAGTDKNFVFSLSPKMAVYESTGFNDHYQYLNIQQQTLPNGLGMGGQLQYFGFWVDAEYGKGKCAPSCTTYNNPQLSAKPEFKIDIIEVWAVGPEPVIDEDEEMDRRPSILDVDVEGMAMLRMLNRGPISEGLRENSTADEPEEKELYIPKPL